MGRMSPETQKELGIPDAMVDFDEFLQMDEGPASEAFAKKHGYTRGKPKKPRPSLHGLKNATK